MGMFNFAGSTQEHYTVHCDAKRLTVLMDTSADIYNGSRPNTVGTVYDSEDGNFTVTLPPFTAICFQAT